MPGLRPHLEHGPETYIANVNIIGGTFVEFDGTTGRIKPTVVNSTGVLGLALGDAAAFATAGAMATTTDAWGRPTAGGLTPPSEVAVAYRGSWWIKNTSGATLGAGTPVYAAANGAIAGTTTGGKQVGVVIEPLGIANNAEGRVRLTLS